MRVKPSVLTALLAFIGYLVVVFAVWAAVALQYDDIGDTVENVRNGIVLAVGLGAIYLIVVTTVFGWWRPALREPRRAGGGWMWAVPVLLFVGAGANLALTKWNDIPDTAQYVAWLALGCALVGFSEEMLTRGLLIVGARGSMHERWVWVFSGLMFGLLHVPNALFGQSAKDTVQQVVFAFAIGMTYYVTRRISGTLVMTMVLHGLWDFSTFANGRSKEPLPAGTFMLFIAVVLGIFALAKILRKGDVVEPGGDQLGAFSAAAVV